MLGFGIGHALDRFGGRVLMSAGSIVLAGSLFGLAHVRTIPEFYAIWGLGFGLGTALTYYAVSFTVVTAWFDERRMDALAGLTFLGALSSTIFYPLNGWLVAAFGWREAVTILGVIQLAITLPLHAFVLRHRPAPPSGIAFGPAMRTAAFWSITTAFALSAFASTLILVEHIAFLISRGFAPTIVAAIVGLWGLMYLPGRSIVAFASRNLSLRLLVAVALALEALGIVVLYTAHSLPAIIVYLALFAGAYGALAPLRGAIIAEVFGQRAYGAIIAAQGIPVAILAALGPVVGGRLTDVFGYGASFEACVIALVIGMFVILIPTGRTPFSS